MQRPCLQPRAQMRRNRQGRRHHPQHELVAHPRRCTALSLACPIQPLELRRSQNSLQVTQHTRKLWVYPIQAKSDVPALIARFKVFTETQTGRRMSEFRSDHGTEYMNSRVTSLFESTGVDHQNSATYTPQQNGRAERVNRSIVEGILAMLDASAVPSSFWAEAAACFTFVKNMSPHSSIGVRIPQALWLGKPVTATLLHSFGCRAWYRVPDPMRRKLDNKGKAAVFLGYDLASKAWRLWDPELKRLIISADVSFDENTMPYKTGTPLQDGSLGSTPAGRGDSFESRPWNTREMQSSTPSPTVDTADLPSPTSPVELHSSVSGSSGPLCVSPMPGDDDSCSATSDESLDLSQSSSSDPAIDTPQEQVEHTPPRTPELSPILETPAAPVASRTFNELVSASPVTPPRFSPASPESPDALDLLGAHLAMHVGESMGDDSEFALPTSDPSSYSEAMQSPAAQDWQAAADEEYGKLHNKYGVFTPVDLSSVPKGAKVLGSKFVFRTKRDQYGHIKQRKARLVAQGFGQRKGIDYKETFAPTVRFTSIRALTAIAASRGYHIIQADIDKAYLHGELKEEIYIRPPKGANGLEGKVLKLHKSIYGLKQAGRTWNDKIDASLRRLGFTRSKSDYCVYVRQNGSDQEFIALYVDDLLFVGPDRSNLDAALDGLEQEYGVKRLGDAEYVLGIQIKRKADGSIALSQRRYMEDVLERFGMADCAPSSVPMSPSSTLLTAASPGKGHNSTPTDQRRYRQLIGSLTYAMTGTRPDIAYAVSTLGRFANAPTSAHWQAAVDVLRYLKGTLDEGIIYGPRGSPLTMQGRSDATWITCPETSRSVNGYHINMAGAAIAWASCRQRRCACSSSDAEYLGLGDCTRTIVGLRKFLNEIHCVQDKPTPLQGDNQGANALAKNPEHHQRSRHVRLSEHIVREHVAEGLVDITYLPTDDMSADALTKPFGPGKFIKFKEDMGVRKIGDS